MNNKGFTLVEVLIGLFIATVAAVSIAYTISSTNKVADAGKKTFIATNLAHEGLELTRAMRDNALFAEDAVPTHTDWVSKYGICDGDDSSHSFEIDYDAAGVPSRDVDPLFTRTLTANCEKATTEDPLTDPAFAEIASKVTWSSPTGDPKEVVLKEKLYNWLPVPTP